MQLVLENIGVNILCSIPLAILYFGFALILCGYKDKFTKKPLILMVIIQTIIDVVSTMTLKEIYGIDTGLPYLLLGIINMAIILKIDLLSSIICNLVSTLVTFIIALPPIYIAMGMFIGKSYDELITITNESNLYKLSLGYIAFAIIFILLIIVYKKNITFINLKKYKIFDKLYKSNKINILF